MAFLAVGPWAPSSSEAGPRGASPIVRVAPMSEASLKQQQVAALVGAKPEVALSVVELHPLVVVGVGVVVGVLGGE